MSNKKQLAVTLRRVADIPRFTCVYEFSNVLQSLKDYGQCNQKKNLHMKKKKIVSMLRPRTEPSTFRSLPPTFVYYSSYFGGKFYFSEANETKTILKWMKIWPVDNAE